MGRPVTIGRMTEAEYLEHDRTHDGKHEFANGEVVAMAGASLAHSTIQSNAQVGLANRLRGGPCRVHGPDLRVRIGETGMYAYPDVTVVCGPLELAPTRPESLENPSAVVEVLSDTTRDYDLGAKAAHYRHRASVQAILFIDSERRMVQLQIRNVDGTWTLSDHVDGAVRLLDVEVPIEELYEGVVGLGESISP
jgi:Uma2 family endonuclease